MNCQYIALMAFLTSVAAFAGDFDFKTVSCVDQNQSLKAPVFLDIQANVPNSASGTRFALGNVIPTDQDGIYKDATALGDINSVTQNDRTLSLTGSFGVVAILNLDTGVGVVSGPIKYDPVSGEYVGVSRITNYPVNCRVSN